MSTATALKPRPFIVPRNTVELELVQAEAEDLKEFVGYNHLNEKEFILRRGLIYWEQHPLEDRVYPTPFILNEDTNLEQLKDLLLAKKIWIAKNPF